MIDTEALRKKVIDLAIQGKLTEQLPSDGDAETLYAQILDQKSQLIKEGKIKKQQTKPMTDTVPFDIPCNWKWVRVGDIEEINLGFTYRPEYVDDGVYFLSAKDISGGKVNFEEAKKVSVETYNNAAYGSKPHKGDVLFCRVGTIGKPQVIYDDVEFCIFVSLGFFRDHFKIIVPEYIALWMNSKLFDKQVDFEVKGALQRNLNTGWLKDFLIPLPPCSEQKRIVERIETINDQIGIIDDLQAKYSNDLAVLKSKVIDAGIQGKLTEQLPEDGDAKDLYAQILNQKSQLIKEGKIKKEKQLPDIAADEIPFEIPENWKWVRLGDISSKISSGNTPAGGKKSDAYVKEGFCFFREQNIYDDGIRDEGMVYISEELLNSRPNSTVLPKDILLNITGGSIGRCAIVPDDFSKGSINQHILIIRMIDERLRHYIHHCLCSPYMQRYIKGKSVGDKDGFSGGRCKNMLIPLPPINEQKRICEKTDLMLAQM
ncbi:restriction endonuclease subunit S [Butyrivibrio sp.]|uniref:restriction endonuclease subunit S n=1 Tax=Butyrivibrio sp. TaxID=28121 RepID=UPI0025BA843A|nr:restriction endonuclease subunit S [Butyrivibrio sp.]MBQ9303816.1 restriction endonuclease subunit S [Butyrivibrio sp.]